YLSFCPRDKAHRSRTPSIVVANSSAVYIRPSALMVTNSIFRLRKSFAASSAAFRVAVVIFIGPAGMRLALYNEHLLFPAIAPLASSTGSGSTSVQFCTEALKFTCAGRTPVKLHVPPRAVERSRWDAALWDRQVVPMLFKM